MRREALGSTNFRRFQVYGQRCSGTNALIRLLENNLPQLEFTEEFGFKHWLVPADRAIPDDVFVVVIARDVGQWLRSLHARPWHVRPEMKALDFAGFIRAEWQTVWDEDFWGVDRDDPRFGQPIAEERCPATGAPFANAIAMRTAKLQNWIDTARRARGHILVSHARLLDDPQGVVRQVAHATGTITAPNFSPVRSYKGQEVKPFELSVYPPLTARDAAHVDRFSDPEIEARFLAAQPA